MLFRFWVVHGKTIILECQLGIERDSSFQVQVIFKISSQIWVQIKSGIHEDILLMIWLDIIDYNMVETWNRLFDSS